MRTQVQRRRGSSVAVVACTLAAVLCADARAQETVVQNLSFQHTGLQGPTEIEIPRFDDAGGTRTLTGVHLRWTFLGAFQVQLENTTDQPVRSDGDATLWITFGATGVTPEPRTFFGQVASVEIGPADDLPGDGPDYVNLGRQAWPFEFEAVPMDLTPYLGDGAAATIDFTAFEVDFVDAAALRPTLSFPRADGDLVVTYTYVPAPGVALALAAGAAVAARVRRR